MFCGYMLNGNYIKKNNNKVSELEKVFDKEYKKIVRNENKRIVFLLGPLYFGYRNYFFLGFILEFFNIISYWILYIIFYKLTNIGPFSFAPLFILLYFFLNKFFWITFSNSIYIVLVNKKIQKIKRKCKTNKEDAIVNIRIRNIYKPIGIAIIIVILPIIVFMFDGIMVIYSVFYCKSYYYLNANIQILLFRIHLYEFLFFI